MGKKYLAGAECPNRFQVIPTPSHLVLLGGAAGSWSCSLGHGEQPGLSSCGSTQRGDPMGIRLLICLGIQQSPQHFTWEDHSFADVIPGAGIPK